MEPAFPVQVVLGEVLEGTVGEGRLRLRVGQVPGLPLGRMKATTFLCGDFELICNCWLTFFSRVWGWKLFTVAIAGYGLGKRSAFLAFVI